MSNLTYIDTKRDLDNSFRRTWRWCSCSPLSIRIRGKKPRRFPSCSPRWWCLRPCGLCATTAKHGMLYGCIHTYTLMHHTTYMTLYINMVCCMCVYIRIHWCITLYTWLYTSTWYVVCVHTYIYIDAWHYIYLCILLYTSPYTSIYHASAYVNVDPLQQRRNRVYCKHVRRCITLHTSLYTSNYVIHSYSSMYIDHTHTQSWRDLSLIDNSGEDPRDASAL